MADLLKSDACQFTVLENHKDALDATRFGQRFSEIMLKYDYIVGDWSNDQLRLKGFYEDERPNTRKTDRISRLSEYLREYCAFGCAYFILKNEEPQLIVFEEETDPSQVSSFCNRGNFLGIREEHNASPKNKGQKFLLQKQDSQTRRRGPGQA
ncbi:MAG: YutD family protein [Streptococcus salivarius]